ncbi:hypothetical protein [Paenibacillus sp. DMB5]|uniref:hypothetical protein n=1 Tax=Paenibacillus sp. DMB5 TaxID=1780103 RepID=UPI00076D4686|nr:hypothetical protein [Paenibacillus sp. DMB5]KUP21711.1 hypothetical protein AWJ19_01820 [Paenibacillus sp. DMB5]
MTDTAGRNVLSLCGHWNYALDPEDKGEAEHWYDSKGIDTQGSVSLPGTLTLNGVGEVQEWSAEMNRESVRSLRQRHSYYGAVGTNWRLRFRQNGQGNRCMSFWSVLCSSPHYG